MYDKFSSLVPEPWVQQRILSFFNRAKTWQEISEGVHDDPGNDAPGSAGTSIGETVAKRILARKGELRGNRFWEFSELEDIQGLGPDKFNDLVYTFGQPAAESFRKAMYNGVVFENNWDLQYRAVTFETQEEFEAALASDGSFTDAIARRVGEWVWERSQNRTLAHTAELYLKECWLEKTGSAHLGGYYMAYYFFRTDEDNWFSFDRVRQETDAYLTYNQRAEFELELRFFKGFEMQGLLTDAITVPDLPVVVNRAERQFEIWASSLSD